MLWALFTLFFIHLCALITPGPDFFMVSQTAISRSRTQAIYVALGISCAIFLWAFFTLLGLNYVHGLLLAVVTIESLIWFLFVVFIFSLPSFKRAYQKATKWIDGLVGGLFGLFGAYLIFNK
jgi:threonine/homoserine/homoserine lactone efflux protein